MASYTEPAHLTRVLVFGDQSDEKLPTVQKIVRSAAHSPIAKRWLNDATKLLQAELSKPDRYEYNACARNAKRESLLALAEENEGENAHGMISAAISCIGRLGELLIHVEHDPSILGTVMQVNVIGICTGLLPAAAVLAATDLEHLFHLSLELVSITCRLTYEIWVRMQLIERGRESWSETYVGLDEERLGAIIGQFHEQEGIPYTKRIAIGVVSARWATLFGCPSSLSRLKSFSPAINDAPRISTLAKGWVHTPYLPDINFHEILAESSSILETPIHSDRAIMSSTRTGCPYQHARLRDLLIEIMEDIVTNKIHLDQCVESCVARLESTPEIRITAFGPSYVVGTLTASLQARSLTFVVDTLESLNKRQIDKGELGYTDEIAIVGMSGRFPGNDTVEGFWKDLVDGKCHIKKVPAYRFDVDKWTDPTLKTKNSTSAIHGAWLENAHLFDNRLFNMSPREARQTDPIHRMLLTSSYEALQMAGYTPKGTPSTEGSRISTFFGQLSEDWHDIIHQKGADIYYAPGIARAFGPSRLNFHYKWGGGSYAVDSACASSMTALVLACRSLKSGESDMALAGGGSLMLTPVPFSGLSRSGMISSTGGCRAFHDDADGYARGEGMGVFILKRVADALADNDNILGVITGESRAYSTTTSSMTHPSHKLYKDVLQQRAQDPSDFSYIEMHGTGTQAGDFEEMTSVLNTFAKERGKDNPLTLGTVKAGLGHSEGAAGSMAVMKVLMMLQHNLIPPQPGWPFKTNTRFPNLDRLNARLATKAQPLRSPSAKHRKVNILINGFDASGGESCLTIQEPPMQSTIQQDPRTTHIVAISAKTWPSFKANHERLYDYLVHHSRTELSHIVARPSIELSHIAYTTTARRIHEPLRNAFVVSSTQELLIQLEMKMKEMTIPRSRPKQPSCIFLFTGQGSQYSSMGIELFNQHEGFRDLLQMYERIAQSLQLPGFVEVITDKSGDISQFSTTSVQLATVALEIAMATTMKEWGINPTAVIGHSLGEYAAMCIAGVLSVSDTLYLVGNRAALIEQHLKPNTHSMLATSLNPVLVEKHIKQLNLVSCNVACRNGPRSTVVSGTVGQIELLKEKLETEKHRTSLLRVTYGFHSEQIDPILDKLASLASHVKISKPTIPFVSSLTGRVERDADTFTGSYFARQARESVNFSGALKTLRETVLGPENCLWVELGPSPILLGLASTNLEIPKANLLPTMRPHESNWSTISQVLKAGYEAGLDIRWPRFHKYHVHCLRLLPLPTYSFDYQDFHMPWTESPDPLIPANTVENPSLKHTSAINRIPQFQSTTSVQRMEKVHVYDDEVVADLRSSTTDPYLSSAIQGHVVDGITICPMSILVDMAFTASQYSYRRMHLTPDSPQMGLRDINMSSAIVLRADTHPPDIGISVVYRSLTKDAIVTFSSATNGGKVSHEIHGTCRVTFEDSLPWSGNLGSMSLFLQSRIESLRVQGATGKAHRLMKSVVYSLFDQAVVYGPNFQGMEEVIIDQQCRDAVAEIKLPLISESGSFQFNPYWTDTLTHLGGFVLNSGLKFSKDWICMAVGFDTWRSKVSLAAGETYTAYTTFRDGEKSTVVVDCYIFRDGELVQELMGLRFQQMKKVVFRALFGDAHAHTSAIAHTHTNGAANSPLNSITAKHTQILPQDLPQITSNGSMTHLGTRKNPSPTKTRQSRRDSITTLESFGFLLSIVARETGAQLADMSDNTSFADLGVDSLLAISIIATLKKEKNVSLPASFFMKHDSIGAAKTALKVEPAPDTPPTSDSECGHGPKVLVLEKVVRVEQKLYPSRVINIQQSRSPSARNIFLLADESGSALNYINLGFLGPNIRAQGIELQLLEQEEAHSYFPDMSSIIESYTSTILSKQENGPFILGGIGTGAIFASEVARNLLEKSKEVSGLLLIDPRTTTSALSNRSKPGNTPREISKAHRAQILRKSLASCSSANSFSTPCSNKIVLVLPERVPSNTTADEQRDWTLIFPTASYRHEDFQTGLFFKFNSDTQLCREIISGMVAS